jgi:hypothetical protein
MGCALEEYYSSVAARWYFVFLKTFFGILHTTYQHKKRNNIEPGYFSIGIF